MDEQLLWRAAQIPHLDSAGRFQNSWNLETWCIYLPPNTHSPLSVPQGHPQPLPPSTQQCSYQQVTLVVLFSQLTLLSLFHTQHNICHWVKVGFTQNNLLPQRGTTSPSKLVSMFEHPALLSAEVLTTVKLLDFAGLLQMFLTHS